MPEPTAIVAGVKLTHPSKIFFPDAGITKLELARYYESVADQILPYIQGRPVSLVRAPRGTEDYVFYQKHPGENFPQFIERAKIKEKEGVGIYIVLDALNDLVYLVNLGVLEFHTWGSKAKDLERPDRLVFDLDPGEGAPWESVVEGAKLLRAHLRDLGLETFVMTTGGKGLHVVAPFQPAHGWNEVKEFTKSVAQSVVDERSEKFTLELPKEKRRGKVFIDYLRNQRGATAITPYSTRARARAPIAAPITWELLDTGVRADTFTLARAPEVQKLNAWANYFTAAAQKLTLPTA